VGHLHPDLKLLFKELESEYPLEGLEPCLRAYEILHLIVYQLEDFRLVDEFFLFDIGYPLRLGVLFEVFYVRDDEAPRKR
jgi:hypothetical protein